MVAERQVGGQREVERRVAAPWPSVDVSFARARSSISRRHGPLSVRAAGARASRRASGRIADFARREPAEHFVAALMVLARRVVARRSSVARVEAQRRENRATRVVARDATVAPL